MCRLQTGVNTKLVRLHPLSVSDSPAILALRLSPKGKTLLTTSAELSDQEAYMESYNRRFNNGEEVYFGIYDRQEPTQLSGLVRMTELLDQRRFNWGSLILSADSPPVLAIDAILAVYSLGFEVLNRIECGPFPVRDDVPRVLKLHERIGMSYVSHREVGTTFLITSAEKFKSQIQKFRNMGLGVMAD